MALVTTNNVDTTLDESAGLQNFTSSTSAGDKDDNDILVSSLPAVFSGRLGVLGASTSSAIGAALSGYTGASGDMGSNVISVTAPTGATITDLGFVGSNGDPLDGVDSGLDTVDGTSILLYTDTNNNIVLGRAGAADGQIVFALYLEETGSPVSGGKIWSVQYAPLKNPNAADPDDAVDLANLVFVAASQDLQFSLAGAPSGQNLFLMFTVANPTVDANGRITDPVIIATGKDPANQSTGVNINTGDTINTSQAGGPTTFGTNSQMITEQEGIRFSFVTGADPNYTIPNLSQTEADVEANVDFTGVFNARSATFDVVQLQSGKSAVVEVSAFNFQQGSQLESGTSFIDGYANDVGVSINHIKVSQGTTVLIDTSTSGTANGVTVAFSNPDLGPVTATISGVKAGYNIEYTTTGDHNRVLIENGAALNATGNTHADFDIGGFKLLQVSTATAEVGSKVNFEDDGPSISTTGTETNLTVDETDLTTSATASFAANFTSAFGTDGAGTLTFALGISDPLGVDSGLVDTATGNSVFLFVESGQVVGREGTDLTDAATGEIVFTVSVVASGVNAGDVTLDQQRAVVHPDTTNPDDAVSLTLDNLVTLTGTITDKDGDSASAMLNIGQNLVFKDDGPSITVSVVAAADALMVNETDLATNASANFADNFSSMPNYGADGAGSVSSVYTLSVRTAGVDSGLVDVATNEAVLLRVNASTLPRQSTLPAQRNRNHCNNLNNLNYVCFRTEPMRFPS